MDYPDGLNDKWTRMPRYPRYSNENGQLSVRDQFSVNASDFDSDDLESIRNTKFGVLRLSLSDAVPNESGQKIIITVTYTKPASTGASTAMDGQAEFTLEDGGQEIPIDKKLNDGTYYWSNYKAKWNYHLAGLDGESTPAWWSTATDINAAVAPFRWIKSPDSLRSGEVIIESKTKNAEAVLSPAPIVVRTAKYKSYTSAKSKKLVPGTRSTPEKTFGYTGEWLVVSSVIGSDGNRWVSTIRYQNATQWDSDFYQQAT